MADETSKEKVVIDFSTNANAAKKDTDNFRASIDATVTSTEEQTQAVTQQDKAYKSMKTQLREANQELTKSIQLYGETSTQAVNAAKGVANLKDQIGFAKDLSESFNPDQKMKALGAATKLAGTGLQGVTSGMALFGDQSKDTQEQLLKVQAAMAFSDAISGLSNIGDQFQVFKSVVKSTYASIITAKQAEIVVTEEATAKQIILNTVAKANPYILLASIIGAVTIATVAWYQASDKAKTSLNEATSAVSKNKMQTEALTESIDESKSSTEAYNNIEVLRAKSLGATDEQIQKIIKSQKEMAVTNAGSASSEAYANLLTAGEAARLAIKTGNKDLIKDAQENQKAAQELYKKSNDSYNQAILADVENNLNAKIEANTKQKEIDDKADQKEQERRDKIAEKKRQEREKELELQKAFDADVLKQQQAMNLARVEIEMQDKADERERLQLQQEETSANIDALDAQNEASAKKQIDTEQKIVDAKKANQQQIVSGGEQLIKNVASLAGKNKAIQKAAIIADGGVSVGKAVANTSEAVTKDLAKGMPFSIPLVALDLAVGATSIASIISGTSKALQAVGGGSAPTAPSLPSSQGISATPQTGFQASSENQISTSINNAQQQTPIIKAFVVGSDVTTQQSLDANLVKQNSFGGAVVK